MSWLYLSSYEAENPKTGFTSSQNQIIDPKDNEKGKGKGKRKRKFTTKTIYFETFWLVAKKTKKRKDKKNYHILMVDDISLLQLWSFDSLIWYVKSNFMFKFLFFANWLTFIVAINQCEEYLPLNNLLSTFIESMWLNSIQCVLGKLLTGGWIIRKGNYSCLFMHVIIFSSQWKLEKLLWASSRWIIFKVQ